MIDDVRTVVRIVRIWLNVSVRIAGPGQQDVSPRLLWCQPVIRPPSPCVRLNAVDKLSLFPRVAAVGAHFDLDDVTLARPCSARNRIALVWSDRVMQSWP